jgi:hypothetical protein
MMHYLDNDPIDLIFFLFPWEKFVSLGVVEIKSTIEI